MSCIPEEVAMLYAEDELPGAEIEDHLSECAACREMVGMLREESVVLSSALREPAPNRRMRALAQMAGSIAASVAVAIPAQWAAARIGEAGMWANHVASVPFEIAFRAMRMIAPLALFIVILQSSASAMTRRSGQGALVIRSQEVIQDAVLATGETVLVEGKIEGNLFMFGRSLEIRGEVDGDVFSGGQDVRITGKVNGNVIAAGETVTVRGLVTGNVYAAGRNIRIEAGGEVQKDVFSGSETVIVDGTVGRGVASGASTAVIAGVIGRGLSFSGDKVLVRSGGKIGGDIRAVMNERDGVQVDQGALVVGKTDVRVRAPSEKGSGMGTYVVEFAVLLGAFLVGWLLLKLLPGFLRDTVQSVLSWASAGWGFAALVITPIAAILLCLTVVGIPIGVAMLMVYLVGLYLAKIVVGSYLGRELLGARDGLPTLLGLLVGVALLQAVFFIPYGGGLLKFGVLCLGLGALTMQLRRQIP